MNKVYTLDDNGEFMADLKAMHEEMLLMKRRLECDEITPDEWRQWLAGYRARLEEAKKAVDEVLENAAPNFILGADCTVPGDTDWEKLRAVIDYAHTWRETHKK